MIEESEQNWDRKLNISTCGRKDSHADEFHHPYEPTPYCVLERIAESGYMKDGRMLVDYGCGRGRAGFFFNYETGCKAAGVEFDRETFQQAVKNSETYCGSRVSRFGAGYNPYSTEHTDDVKFYYGKAEEYEIGDGDMFFFFNPFTVEILKSVVERIKESYYASPRRMRMFFYYPDDDYMSFLLTDPEIDFVDEIDCKDFFGGGDRREIVAIFDMADF